MKKIFGETKPAGQLLGLTLIFVVLFIIGSGIMVVATLFGGKQDSVWLQALSQIVIFGGSALLFAMLFHGKPFEYLRMSRMPVKASQLVGAFLILLCVLPLSDWLANINDGWHLPESMAALEDLLRQISATSQALMEQYLLRDDVVSLVVNLFILALLPALCEEMLFRGGLQQSLQHCFGNHHAAIWVTAAIFSLMHGEVFAFLPRFMLGALLGYLFYYGGSLWVNATAHFTNNAIVVVLYHQVARGNIDYSVAETFHSPWYLAIAGLAVAVVLFAVFFKEKCSADEKCDVNSDC